VVDPQPSSRSAPRSRAVARRLRRAWQGLATGRQLGRERAFLPAILAALEQHGVPGARGWVSCRGVAGDPTIFLVGPAGARPKAAVRIARGPAGRRGLTRAAAALTTIHAGLGGTGSGVGAAALVPRLLATGEAGGRPWLAESALPGRSGATLLEDATERRVMLRRIADGIAAVHAASGLRAPVTDDLLGAWVDRRVATVRSLLEVEQQPAARAERLARLGSEVRSAVGGRELAIGWIHGDLWPANVLVHDRSHDLTGIVDWDSAASGELPLHDLLHLAITTRRLVEHRHLGEVVADLLGGATWTPDDRAALGWDADVDDAPAVFDGLDATTAIRLYWLRAVEVNVERRPGLARQRAWVRANVVSVLA
jgi:aminoglycoside phosphotransferase (APT) family kinase protein